MNLATGTTRRIISDDHIEAWFFASGVTSLCSALVMQIALFHFLRRSVQVCCSQTLTPCPEFASARSSPHGLIRGISRGIYTHEDGDIGIRHTQSNCVLTSPIPWPFLECATTSHSTTNSTVVTILWSSGRRYAPWTLLVGIVYSALTLSG
jgi:hypothetical protein